MKGKNAETSNASPLLPSEEKSKPNPTPSQEEVDELCAELYAIGISANQCHPGFNGKYRDELGRLLSTYSAQELREAYTAFVKHRDDFAIQHAPKHFVEGGVRDVLAPIRKRKRERQELEAKWRAAEIERHSSKVKTQMLEEQEELGKEEPPDSLIRQRYDLAVKTAGTLPLSMADEKDLLSRLRDDAASQPEFQAALQARLDRDRFDPGPCDLSDNQLCQQFGAGTNYPGPRSFT